ncbi:CHAT domain-containing protein [Mycena latifolia]|nr:CHAT domain-containing protein [Mycena latifolia]
MDTIHTDSCLPPLEAPTDPTQEISDILSLADSMMKDCLAASNIADVNTTIYLLVQVLHASVHRHPECLDLLATALLTRFSLTCDWNDVKVAGGICSGMVAGSIHEHTNPQVAGLLGVQLDPEFRSDSAAEIVLMAATILTDFQKSVDLPNLNTAILLYQEAVSSGATADSEKSKVALKLYNAHLIRFRATESREELQEAISLSQELYMAKPKFVSCFCAALLAGRDTNNIMTAAHLIREAEISDNHILGLAENASISLDASIHSETAFGLDAALGTLEKATISLSWGHPGHAFLHSDLATGLSERFRMRGQPQDLDQAITLLSAGLEFQTTPQPDRPESMRKLATLLHKRFDMTSDTVDLNRAVSLHHKALNLLPPSHPDYCTSLNHLGGVLYKRFTTGGQLADLASAIELQHRALDLQPAPHPEHCGTLCNLGLCLEERFSICGDPQDLDTAIELLYKAHSLEADQPTKGNLAKALIRRSKIRAATATDDLEKAIALYNDTLNFFSCAEPIRLLYMNNLAAALQTRFEIRGDPLDLNVAINLLYQTLECWPPLHPDRKLSVNTLASALDMRFDLTRDLLDLDHAIELHREALKLHPESHVGHIMYLTNLATSLQKRFRERGDPADLEGAIGVFRRSVELRPHSHPDRALSLHNLAAALHERFDRIGQLEDLEVSIELHHEALKLRPGHHPARVNTLINLASVLESRFKIVEEVRDLDSALEHCGEALNLLPSFHQNRVHCMNIQGNLLTNRFQAIGNPADLESSINIFHEILDLVPLPNLTHLFALANMANTLVQKYIHSSNASAMDEAVIALRQASTYATAPIYFRYETSARWAHAADAMGHKSEIEAYSNTIELLPQLATLALDIQARQRALISHSDPALAADAAACALRLQRNDKAVEFLEAGRSIFWAQAMQLQPDLHDLESAHPEIAQQLYETSKKLELGSHRDVSALRMVPHHQTEHESLEKENKHYRELNAMWAKILDHVRQQPGFERFLLPKLMDKLKNTAINGPIVILNAGKMMSSCTALIVHKSGDVQSLSLDKMATGDAQLLVHLLSAVVRGSETQIMQILAKGSRTSSTDCSILQDRLLGKMEDAEHFHPDKVFSELLAGLWDHVVQPVFDALKLQKTDKPKRLWWCPTGPFAFLPIHAAGHYGADTDCVSEYVISSYTPTLASLLDPPTEAASPFKMTALIQPTTPGHSSLPATMTELLRIRDKVPETWLTRLGDTSSTKVDIALHHIRDSSLVHFACHGAQDFENPLDSGLLLNDGRLKVSDLMRGGEHSQLKKKTMRLAFLSACETAKGDEKLPDEAMHLAATLLFAGFRGVVATMWTMMDADGPRIAETFYDHLFKGSDAKADPPVLPDLTKAAEALHIAVAKLRADPNVSFSRWVPFVHYGL